jgi:glycosyltransferase involved in cell wall biosynthesis
MEPTVTVIMPIFNEEKYIHDTVCSLMEQDYPKEKMEWLFVDGHSEDRTAEILHGILKDHPKARILDNPARQIAHGLNIGIREAAGEYIVRMDAHSEYARNYISMCIETILNTGADIVGGPMLAAGKTAKQKAIAAALHSKFALGGNDDHDENYEGYTKAVYYGCFRREMAVKVGLYNEKMIKTEDDDFYARVIQAGGKIYQTPKIKMTYYPRNNFIDLWKQYYAFGYWKMDLLKEKRVIIHRNQLVPSLFVLFLVVGAFLSFYRPFRMIYIFIVLLYLILCAIFSSCNPKIHGAEQRIMLFWAHIVIHLSYGIGGCRRILECR